MIGLPAKRDRPRRSSRVLDPAYLAWLRLQRCQVATMLGLTDCWGPVDPEHERYGVGMGQRASDRRAWSCCRRHHDQRHDGMGWCAGWPRQILRDWIAARIAESNAAYEAIDPHGGM